MKTCQNRGDFAIKIIPERELFNYIEPLPPKILSPLAICFTDIIFFIYCDIFSVGISKSVAKNWPGAHGISDDCPKIV